MDRPSYVCVTCEQHFTRHTSAKRHIFNIHNGIGEIVTLLEYLVGRNSDRYRPSHRSMYRRRRKEHPIHNFEHATTIVADSMGDTSQRGGLQGQGQGQYHPYQHQYHRYLQQQQTPLPSIQLPPPIQLPSSPPPTSEGVSSYPKDQMFHFQSQSQSQPMKTRNEWGTLSQETILKIAELRGLLYRHSTTFPNFDMIIQGAKHFAIMGDNTVLDEMLAYLHSIDAIR